MANGMTRRGAIIGVGAVGAASCATAGATTAASSNAQVGKKSGEHRISEIRMGMDELAAHAMLGAMVVELFHAHRASPGGNKSGVVDIGFALLGDYQPKAEDAVGCCLVPVSVGDGDPLKSGVSAQEAYEKILAMIGIPAHAEPLGCVKCIVPPKR